MLQMKHLLIFTILLLLNTGSYAQNPFEKWEAESKTNKRLLPKYGNLPKTEEQIKSDSDFVREILAMPQFKTRREASNHMISLGFQYYYRPDLKTAMYRFNQAYLLDSTNADIYWGYGAIYMAFGQFELARSQYETGLKKDSVNTHLLTDVGTWYSEMFVLTSSLQEGEIFPERELRIKHYSDSAVYFLNKSYRLDSKDVNTVYKLSIAYLNKRDCDNAWKYYNEAMALGGRPVTKEYIRDLELICKRK